MKKIGLLSDTHGYIDDRIMSHLSICDEIWHAGDFGTSEVLDQLKKLGPVRGVFGNIDGMELRKSLPEELLFDLEELKVWIIHIGGYPPKYSRQIKDDLKRYNPGLFICGHSHILKVVFDKERNLLHINPGAAGHAGFHVIRTMVRFEINQGKIENLEVIELGRRGK